MPQQAGLKNSTQSIRNQTQDTASAASGMQESQSSPDQVMHKGSELLGQAKEAVTDLVSTGSDRFRNWFEDAGNLFSDGSRSVREQIQRRPLQAILIGLGVGALLGMMLNMRSRD